MVASTDWSAGRTSEQARKAFEAAAADGARLVALTSFGPPDAPLHNLIWARPNEPVEQRLELDVGLAALEATVRRHAAEGFYVAAVSMTGPAPSSVLALLFERAPPGGSEPELVRPAPFRDASGVFFLHRALAGRDGHATYVRSIACAGAPEDDRGTGLMVTAVLWPQPDVHIASAVHLDEVAPGERWQSSSSVAVVESVARPVVALPVEGGKWVLSLWHDTTLAPWPSPDPLAPGPRAIVDESFGVPISDVLSRIEARADEDLGPVAIGVHGDLDRCSALIVHGDVRAPIPLRRQLTWREAGGATSPSSDHPLDAWMRRKMSEIGARHAQLVVMRGSRTPWARAYTFAEPGYPSLTLDGAMRLGSVSKPVTAMALMRHLVAEGPDLLDESIFGAELLDLPVPAGVELPSVSLRELLTHRAGLHSFQSLRPDDPNNPVSEDRVAAALGKPDLAPDAGDLRAALAHFDLHEVFGHEPPGLAESEYANEGYVLVGELVGKRLVNRFDGYARAMTDLFLQTALPDAVDDVQSRGVLLGLGPEAARARRESPAHPSSPTWCEERSTSTREEPGLVLPPYRDNGRFLGGAAGLCVPLTWIARLVHVEGGKHRWADERMRLGFQRGPAGYWTTTDDRGRRTCRVMRLHHNGRIEGGSALLVHQAPLDAASGSEAIPSETITAVVAFNQLGPLYFEPDGTTLLRLLKELERDPDYRTRDALGTAS